MRESALKSLDWLMAAALLAAWPFGWLMAKWMRRKPDGTAIVRPGGMGDLICLDMALQSGRGSTSERVTYYLDGRSTVWAGYRGLDFVRYDRKFLRTLLSGMGRYEKVIVTEQFFGAAAVYGLLLAGTRSRVYGFATQRMKAVLGHVVEYSPVGEHEVSAFARLARCAEGDPAPAPLSDAQLVRERTHPATGNDLWVSIAGRGVPSRELSADEFAAIVQVAATGRPVTVTFQPSDKPFALEVARKIPNARLFEGTFAQLCDALARAPEMVTIDGGMVHVGSYFGIPSQVLFSAGIVQKWRPLGRGSRVAQSPEHLPCRPCTRFGQVPPCPIQYACKSFPTDILAPHAD